MKLRILISKDERYGMMSDAPALISIMSTWLRSPEFKTLVDLDIPFLFIGFNAWRDMWYKFGKYYEVVIDVCDSKAGMVKLCLNNVKDVNNSTSFVDLRRSDVRNRYDDAILEQFEQHCSNKRTMYVYTVREWI